MKKLLCTTILLIFGLLAFPSWAAIQLSPTDCLMVYGKTAYDLAVKRDSKVPKDTFLKEYNEYLSRNGVPLDDESVLIMKDLINYVYLSPKTKEELFDEKSSQCLSQKGVLRKDEVL